ncbi:MAG: hypothetical protein OET90_02555 [Desulfuromonadales bacterium]|nr:hypothetical protein [Desulfuromonadales bacterium]
MLEKVDDKKFTEIIAYLSRMGALVTMGEPSYSKILTASVIKEGEQTFVTYTMDATYENGDAVVEIILLDLDGDFQVYQFDIKSLTLGE